MKVITIIANLIFLIFVVYVFAQEENITKGEAIILSLCFLFPILNVIALLSLVKGNNYFSLYFQRKSLEQHKKIIELQKDIEKETNKTS
tara:strand:+ start:153 stop:419 length:267 start_codon:yes stop_codon:yes gene_type:complete